MMNSFMSFLAVLAFGLSFPVAGLSQTQPSAATDTVLAEPPGECVAGLIDYENPGADRLLTAGYAYNEIVRTTFDIVQQDLKRARLLAKRSVPARLGRFEIKDWQARQASVAAALVLRNSLLASLEKQHPEIRTSAKPFAFPRPLIASRPFVACNEKGSVQTYADERALFWGEPSVRVVGDFCAGIPTVKIQATYGSPTRKTGVRFDFVQREFFIQPEFFYYGNLNPDDDHSFAYEDLWLHGNSAYSSFLKLLEAIVGLRQAQCGDLPSQMNLIVEKQSVVVKDDLSNLDSAFAPLLKADLYLSKDGIDGLLVYDDAPMLAAMDQTNAQRDAFRKSLRRPPSEESLGLGLLVILGGIAAMSMNNCQADPRPFPECPNP